MKIPLSWLKEFLPIALSPTEISDLLTGAGLEVEGIEQAVLNFEGVVVGKVVEAKKHPNAEKLSLAIVTDGKEYFQVVCGAPNCRSGIKTAFAKIGAVLKDPDGKTFKIKKSKLRGEDSCGMLCSAKDLGLSEEHEGIIEFSDAIPEGQDVSSLYSDAIFDINLTPNLNHCSNILGVARELAALTGLPLSYPRVGVEESSDPIQSAITLENQATEDCPRYCCRILKGVRIAPSPDWIASRLTACGIRPINNVVDITNYVLLELGHPLHAFDYDTLANKTLIVRKARNQETLVSLDGQKRVLDAQDLLIADPSKPLALAGVMGGQESEVTENTTNILLESAYFSPMTIRRSAKRHGLQTEASRRFERGADPHQALISLNRAASLIHEICGGQVLNGMIDLRHASFPQKVISCSVNRINALLGTSLALGEVETIFQRLQFRTSAEPQDRLSVHIPSYRVDIHGEIDLVEEVARIYGYHNLPRPPLRYRPSTLPNSPIHDFEEQVRRRLLREGLQEMLTCDLISPKMASAVESIPKETIISLLNPSSSEQSVLRPSLMPGLLQVVKTNQDGQNFTLAGFEIGKVHFRAADGYQEQSAAALLWTGKSRQTHWERKAEEVDFYDIKGVIENLLQAFGFVQTRFVTSDSSCFHPGRQSGVMIDTMLVGTFGEVHPRLLRQFGIEGRVYFAELDLHDLFKGRKAAVQMQELPVYPGSHRDWTLTLEDKIPVEEVVSILHSIRSRLLESCSLIDVWHGERLGPGKKNITFHFIYRDAKRTLSLEEIDAEHTRITQGVLEKLQKTVR